MEIDTRLKELEEEASLDIRMEKALETNPEYLKLSIDSFLKKYEPLLEMTNLEAVKLLKEMGSDRNFKFMYSFYKIYFDRNKNEHDYGIDLYKISEIKDINQLKKLACDKFGMFNPEGIISPEGIFYPAIDSHFLLCAWLNLKGIDLRQYVRTVVGSKSSILFSDLTDYVFMNKEKDFSLTEKQIKAMETLFRLAAKDLSKESFHNLVESSYEYGFCKFSSLEKTRKQIGLIEDVLGKKQVNSAEILSHKVKYY